MRYCLTAPSPARLTTTDREVEQLLLLLTALLKLLLLLVKRPCVPLLLLVRAAAPLDSGCWHSFIVTMGLSALRMKTRTSYCRTVRQNVITLSSTTRTKTCTPPLSCRLFKNATAASKAPAEGTCHMSRVRRACTCTIPNSPLNTAEKQRKTLVNMAEYRRRTNSYITKKTSCMYTPT